VAANDGSPNIDGPKPFKPPSRADFDAAVHDIEDQVRAANEKINARTGRPLFIAIAVGVGLGAALLLSLLIVKELFMLFAGALLVISVFELATALRAAGRKFRASRSSSPRSSLSRRRSRDRRCERTDSRGRSSHCDGCRGYSDRPVAPGRTAMAVEARAARGDPSRYRRGHLHRALRGVSRQLLCAAGCARRRPVVDARGPHLRRVC